MYKTSGPDSIEMETSTTAIEMTDYEVWLDMTQDQQDKDVDLEDLLGQEDVDLDLGNPDLKNVGQRLTFRKQNEV